MRCLTLANALRRRGVTVSFVCRTAPGDLCDLIESQNIPLARLSEQRDNRATEGRARPELLAREWRQDVDETRAAIERTGDAPSWLVVDHYGLDHHFETALRRSVDHVFVIDDLANRSHDCDLLLDQNLVANLEHRYVGLVPTGCRTMLGPDYALLNPLYAEAHDSVALREGRIRRCLIFFGGADRENLTGRSLEAVISLARSDLSVDVVYDPRGPHGGSIRQSAAARPMITLHSDLPNLVSLMAAADLAIGAGGSAAWERLCVGLPALAVNLAENQRPIVAALQAHGLVRTLGSAEEATTERIVSALAELLERGLDAQWSRACLAAVDGRGAARVVAALGAAAPGPLRARPISSQDESRVLEWANNPATRRHAFSTRAIMRDEHRRWFEARLGEGASGPFLIIETARGDAMGQVRFQRQAHEWEVHYALAPAYRGQGLGAALLGMALDRLRQAEGPVQVFGQVKRDNPASHRVFTSLGFAVRCETASGVIVFDRRA
jgi:UDP-2,4-diacetamido-2,4,6-trideoxy-beta-L-altropyranose hydrolase